MGSVSSTYTLCQCLHVREMNWGQILVLVLSAVVLPGSLAEKLPAGNLMANLMGIPPNIALKIEPAKRM